MIEIHGKYSIVKIYVNDIEPEAFSQIVKTINHESSEGCEIRIMPDVHAGAGCVIGYTSTLGQRVVPNLIGVDIGCGMLSTPLGNLDWTPERLSFLDELIHKEIPSGFNIHSNGRRPFFDLYSDTTKSFFKDTCNTTKQDYDRVLSSIGTLGGGNHFVELGVDESGCTWLTIHSGSRNFGLRIAKFYQEIAKSKCGSMGDLEYLTGEDKYSYLTDMSIAQEYASLNRKIMMKVMLHGLIKDDYFRKTINEGNSVESIHNYIDLEQKIIRKGAISAMNNEMVIIPWNMRDGLIIAKGKGNPDWNYSAPHGAGRIMARGKAKRSLDIDDFKKSMEGIYSTCISKETIDESPMVYKNHEEIKELIKDTVEVIHVVKPIYNFKAGAD
jgi:tRNA-splicing ligase RtcB (3'-phosphate/5'-hydroxy nucleic acid ligase)